MKIILLLLVIVFWVAFGTGQRNTNQDSRGETSILPDYDESSQYQPSVFPKLDNSSQYRCNGRTYCSQMTSCEEATWVLRNCPNTQMDGDDDGVPCEQQWCQ
ncbi:MAG: excalibur calcium-binding domain-containing protein [Zoogloeaceae bacterium]|jgi:hypothetical protein|nr:excalibur calcium-binding domain-containing protein [Zoogloeaceae bacterium]